MKKQKGITLIALVITIIVLLILAGVTISMVVGDNGILTRADNASENTRGGKVEEAKTLWQNEKKIAGYDEDSNIKIETQEELLTRLVTEGSLTENEKKEIEETGQVTIGNKTIVFGKQEITGITIKEVNQSDIPSNVNVSDVTFPNNEGKVSIPQDGYINMIYKVEIAGFAGTEYTAKCDSATHVGGNSMKGEIPETGVAIIWITKKYTRADIDSNGNINATVTVIPGKGNESSTSSTTITSVI